MAKSKKVCVVCGKAFQGTAKSEVCGATCRKRLSRLKKEGKQPQFKLIGGKNTKPEKPVSEVHAATKNYSKSKEKKESIFDGIEIPKTEKILSKVEQLRKLREEASRR